MNIHEYQAKEILKKYGIRVPVGHVIYNSGEAKETVKNIPSKTNSWAVKAQILAGGRGKAYKEYGSVQFRVIVHSKLYLNIDTAFFIFGFKISYF